MQQKDSDIEDALRELTALRADMVADAEVLHRRLAAIHPNYRDSARNLLHYLALRRHDLRPLQLRLAALGLSSLGRAESHVLATVDAVLEVLHQLANRRWQNPPAEERCVDFRTGQRLLSEHTDALLGPPTPGRDVRIMVTMPTEAGSDYSLVHDLLRQGMDCMRINCAHDDAETWRQMIEHLRRAERAVGRSCRVVMDLAGPKLRTGPLAPGPAVVKVRPQRDPYGRVITPARVWLTADGAAHPAPSPADVKLAVPPVWLEQLQTGDRVQLTDARNSRRIFAIADVTEGGCWVEATKTTYLIPGTELHHEHAGNAHIGDLPPRESAIRLRPGDSLILTRDTKPGRPAITDSAGKVLTPASIGCTIPAVFDDVRAGDSIWFDDGKIGGVLENIEPQQVFVRITHARPRGENLRADKGINLPDSPLRLSALTAKDLADLSFIARHADVVQLSFANSAEDVALLQQHQASLGGRQPAITLKIETRRGFENLPDMLLTAMRAPCCGVMIARGDLAVECGFERLAEVQEEILWICEAAHVPVIWATQVLETLAKVGMPSRAEITDAAMGHRAECVMLNKGPHMLTAVRVLDDILRRMQAHQAKKQAMLRELRLAHTLPPEASVNTNRSNRKDLPEA
ncbi:pyruvate kinase [Microbulbifer donghaiensis]|uniref:pyruvate kinase n=1 Tax=Microbulbifer donghaiensis TaxID=494016 RepID=A0A1M5GW10_9GAMM|nr:pyruvate kinase [Microbulbifer donghaiensis]SHG07847.1 pyruvate kinase [Microbulbifer donghaiensis]